MASSFEPDVARAYLLPSNFPMIQPAKEGEQDRTPVASSGELAAFSSHLFANNVGVSLIAFALGMTLGIGTAWLLFSNGVLMGRWRRCLSRPVS